MYNFNPYSSVQGCRFMDENGFCYMYGKAQVRPTPSRLPV
jgi:hypothetical protein